MLKDKRAVTVFTQAKATAYSILDYQENEYIKVPIDPNTLNYSAPSMNKKYLKTLFCNKENPKLLSRQFKANLISYYAFLSTFLILHLSNQIVVHLGWNWESKLSITFFSVGVFILITSYIVLIIVVLNYKQRLYSRYWFTGLSVLVNFFLIITDQRVLAGLNNQEPDQNGFQHSILIVLVMYMSNLVLRDSTVSLWVILIVSVLFDIGFQLIFGIAELFPIIFQTSLIMVVGLILISESQMVEYRSKQLFYRKVKEEQQNMIYENEGVNISSSYIQDICNSCIHIHEELSKVKNIILFNQARNSLKGILHLLRSIIHKIAHTMSSNKSYLTIEQNDEESVQFLSEFLDITDTLNPRKPQMNTRVTRKSMMRIPKVADSKLFSSLNSQSAIYHVGINWNFDIWFLYGLLGETIVPIANHLYQKWNFGSILTVNLNNYSNYFIEMEKQYPHNPYHNACHASDVLHSLVYFIEKSQIMNWIEPQDLLAVIVAAIGHDVCHPGVNNRFLINSHSKLAVTYNDQSVLQNMHAAKTFQISKQTGKEIFLYLNKQDFYQLRKLVIQMILETDLSKHLQLIGRFRTRAVSLNDFQYENKEDKAIILSMGLKAADLSHSARIHDLHLKWTQLITEEFFLQGDMEIQQDLPVSMFCSREDSNLPKNQIGFLKSICIPMYEVWCEYLDQEEITRSCLMQAKENLEEWRRRSTSRNHNTVIQKHDSGFEQNMIISKHINSASL